MKKLALKIEDLRVDTFETADTAGSRGTVMANGETVNGETCAPSCPYTCGILPPTADCEGFGPVASTRDDFCPVCA
ncbi:hypothetical protein [Longimicrobium sp.]|uniref:hypothetical protein n=1 Tax=Longimicrobium sp. TaxID=2029185 RepID=UPI002E37FAB7|nr:hypothetical protein [Longimicrobium sp.]HEX6040995.1 hypothetical protein [Longimicrobium sp.]